MLQSPLSEQPSITRLWCVAYISSIQNIALGYQYDFGVTQQRWRLRRLWVIAAIMFQVFSRYFLIHCCITRLTEHCAFLLLRQVLRVNSVHDARRITSVKQLQCGNPLFSIKHVTFLHVPPRWAVDEATLVSSHYSFDITVSFSTGFASAQVRPSAHEETLWRVNPSRSGYCIVVNEVGHILPRHLCNPVKTAPPTLQSFYPCQTCSSLLYGYIESFLFFCLSFKHSFKEWFSYLFFRLIVLKFSLTSCLRLFDLCWFWPLPPEIHTFGETDKLSKEYVDAATPMPPPCCGLTESFRTSGSRAVRVHVAHRQGAVGVTLPPLPRGICQNNRSLQNKSVILMDNSGKNKQRWLLFLSLPPPPPWNIYSRRSLSCEHRSVSWQIFTPSTSVNTIKCAEDDDGCCCLSCASIHLPAFPWDPQRAFHTINDVSWTNVINWGVSAQ